MIERVVENWLINASEKAFQGPFCHLLAHEGYTVLHLSRHCAMEMGKDIIAVSREGTPFAFQLKATLERKVSLNKWRTELLPQVEQLVHQAIQHPGVSCRKHHRSVLVINGELDEEASVAITQYSAGLRRSNKLDVVLRGALYRRFMDLRKELIPSEVKDLSALLELYLDGGTGVLSKERLAGVFESVLGSGVKAGESACKRSIAASAVACGIATNNFEKHKNHVALFEAWTMFCAYTLWAAQKGRLKKADWEPSFKIGLESLRRHLEELSNEIACRDCYTEGDALTDIAFYRIRLTHLVGLVSLLGLWKMELGEDWQFCAGFVKQNLPNMTMWGEYAVPQFLATYLFLSRTDATLKPTLFLSELVATIAGMANHVGGGVLPSPEIDPEEYVLEVFTRHPMEKRHTFQRGSYSLEGLLHILVRANMKQATKRVWPMITRCQWKRLEPESKNETYRWHLRRGMEHDVYPKFTKNWSDLRTEAAEDEGRSLPELLRRFPLFYLAFLIVYPHRMSADGLRWLDSKLDGGF